MLEDVIVCVTLNSNKITSIWWWYGLDRGITLNVTTECRVCCPT